MKATVIAITQEVDSISSNTMKECAIEFAGKQAGICYMKDSYFNSPVTDPIKAVKRFHTVAGSGHHSIADHFKVTILFENISKMLAMVLNSLQDYCTSEKSGRYTVMTGNSRLEQDLYSKWVEIFVNRIKEINPAVDDKMAEKLAQENARYFLSVFTKSTTMSYATSLRQWNYIFDWCESYLNTHQSIVNNDESLFFEVSLYQDIKELYETLKNIDGLYIKELRDLNNRHFSFLARQTCDIMSSYDIDEQIGDMYRVIYNGSFVQLAQAQRHRTLKYFMIYDGKTPSFFYVPPMIRGTELEIEWVSDMNKVADKIPQGTMVQIIECGYIGDFFLKCNERLCGRAQHEIMMQTCETLKKFYLNRNSFSKYARARLEKYIIGLNGQYNISAKCIMRGGCKEPCMHGSKHAFDRLF